MKAQKAEMLGQVIAMVVLGFALGGGIANYLLSVSIVTGLWIMSVGIAGRRNSEMLKGIAEHLQSLSSTDKKALDHGPFRTRLDIPKDPEPEPAPQEKLYPHVEILLTCPKCGDININPKFCNGCERSPEKEHLHISCDCGFRFLSETR